MAIEIPDFYGMSDEELYKEWAPGLTYIGGGNDYKAMRAKLGASEEEHKEELDRLTVAFYEEVTRRCPSWIRCTEDTNWAELSFPDKWIDLFEECDAWWWVDKEEKQIEYQFLSASMENGARDACIKWGARKGLFETDSTIHMHLGRGVMYADMKRMRKIAITLEALE